MQRCPNPQCQTENPSGANYKYCFSCGTALPNAENSPQNTQIDELPEKTKERAAFLLQIDDLTRQLLKNTEDIQKLNTELTAERTKNKQSETKQKRNHILLNTFIVVFVVIVLGFAITTGILLSQKRTLKEQITHTENTIIKPLQAEHDFTPQTYKATVDRMYFYDDNFNRTSTYIYYGDEVKITRIKGNFGSGIYTDSKGTILSGWLRLGDVKKISIDEIIKNFVNNYYHNIQNKKYDELSKMFANQVNKYYRKEDIYREEVIKDLKNYDNRFGVSEKKWEVRWNTLNVSYQSEKIFINYLVDYTIVREDKTKPSYFLLQMYFELNSDYQITSIDEKILEKK